MKMISSDILINSEKSTAEIMRDKADAWQMDITSITWEFSKLTEDLQIQDLQYRPTPTTWSIAENLSHLIQTNSSYFPIFEQVIAGTYEAPLLAKIPYVANGIGQLLHRTMSSKTKMKTMRQWAPLPFEEDIVSKFENHQLELSNYIQRLEPFFDEGIIIHSPASRLLPYRLDQAIDILVAHEKRHLKQCKGLLQTVSR